MEAKSTETHEDVRSTGGNKNKTIKSVLKVVVLAMINKKTDKELVVSNGKIGIRFHLSHSHVF